MALSGIASFLVTVGTLACICGLLALGLNVHYGYPGLLNSRHVALFAA
jgi:branched-chain amino acid transport system permease protein